MNPSSVPVGADPGRDFVAELLRTGLMLTDLMADLLELTPPDAFEGEHTGDVLVEMLIGTVRPAIVAAGPSTVAACTALLGALCDRTLSDLEAAATLARGREGRA